MAYGGVRPLDRNEVVRAMSVGLQAPSVGSLVGFRFTNALATTIAVLAVLWVMFA